MFVARHVDQGASRECLSVRHAQAFTSFVSLSLAVSLVQGALFRSCRLSQPHLPGSRISARSRARFAAPSADEGAVWRRSRRWSSTCRQGSGPIGFRVRRSGEQVFHETADCSRIGHPLSRRVQDRPFSLPLRSRQGMKPTSFLA